MALLIIAIIIYASMKRKEKEQQCTISEELEEDGPQDSPHPRTEELVPETRQLQNDELVLLPDSNHDLDDTETLTYTSSCTTLVAEEVLQYIPPRIASHIPAVTRRVQRESNPGRDAVELASRHLRSSVIM